MRRDYNELPKEIQENGFDFHWNKEKLWALDVPITEINVSLLIWQLDLPFWTNEGKKYNLCPRLVLENIDLYLEHKNKILNADISHPIDIMENQNGKMEILDGVHRLIRLMLEGNKKVKVRHIDRKFIPIIES